MKKIKITIIGAGSSYTPEIIDGLLDEYNSIQIGEIVFYDIDKTRVAICAHMAQKMMNQKKVSCNLVIADSLEDALRNADFIVNQIRVGCMDARINDEKIPLQFDLLGQETTGAGGFANGLRTIPEVVRIAKLAEKLCPDCWFLNFANPSGMVTQAILDNTNIKAIGLCNGPINMISAIEDIVGSKDYEYEFIGLNHLCWITSVTINNKEIINELFNGEFEKASALNNIPETEYDTELLKATGGLPIGYLNYYYFREQQVQKVQSSEKTRGEICKEIENQLFELYKDPSVDKKPELLSKRGGVQYSQMAVSVIKSIITNDQKAHVINTKNNDAYTFMDYNDIVEVKTVIRNKNVETIPYKGNCSEYIRGMMQSVKSYEKLTINAALTGNKSEALAALMVHPLVGDYYKSRDVLELLLEANKEYLNNFFTYGEKK